MIKSDVYDLILERQRDFIEEEILDDVAYDRWNDIVVDLVDTTDEPIPMDEFDDYFENSSPSKVAMGVLFGGRFNSDGNFSFQDPYFYIDGYGNPCSIPNIDKYYDVIISTSDIIDWIVDKDIVYDDYEYEFRDWCKENGIPIPEDDE